MSLQRAAFRARWEPYTAQLAVVRAAWVAAVSLPRRARREVWIGDSHAASFLVGATWSTVFVGPRGEVVIRAGARLMHSLARRGFPGKVLRFAGIVGRLGRADSFVPIFVAGEIDVRNSLASRPEDDLSFVTAYVERARGLATRMKSSHCYVLVPPPPCPRDRIDASFPSKGTDHDRLAAFERLRAALGTAVEAHEGVTLLDLTTQLAGSDGMLRPEFTDDGCHTNERALPVVRAALSSRPGFVTGQVRGR